MAKKKQIDVRTTHTPSIESLQELLKVLNFDCTLNVRSDIKQQLQCTFQEYLNDEDVWYRMESKNCAYYWNHITGCLIFQSDRGNICLFDSHITNN